VRALFICILLSGIAGASFSATQGGRAEYVGGTVAELQPGRGGRLVTTSDTHMVFQSGRLLYVVPWERIHLLEYGQKVGRRYALAAVISPLFVLSKSRRHFLTVGFEDDNGGRQALVFRVNKGDIRMLLVSLEAKTNLNVEYQDDEARRAGKGN